MRDIIIVGSGPAGLTAALYTARANLRPLVLAGIEPGGQLTTTTAVDNFPGFPEGVQGPALMARMRAQAERFGAEVIDDVATRLDLSGHPFSVHYGEGHEECRALIVATGASARLLGLPAEKALMGHGVSTCATCDGFFYREKKVLVVGGGDSAVEEATFLTKFASRVTVVHRRDELRASKIMQERAFANPKVYFLWDSVIEDILDVRAGVVDGAVIRNVKTGESSRVACDGIFIAIGHTPNTELLRGQMELDEQGYVITRNGSQTSVPGVFAAGDVQDHRYRQAITAAGSGCMAAIDAEKFLQAEE